MEEDMLTLPDTEAVRNEVRSGGSAITFMQVSMSILDRVEEEIDLDKFGDELRFIRDCLRAGRSKTQLSVQLLDDAAPRKDVRKKLAQTYASSSSGGGHGAKVEVATVSKRQGYELRGALWAVKTSPTGTLPPLVDGTGRDGLPWMGPPVPIWPLMEMPSMLASKLQTLFDEQFNTWDFDVFELSRLTDRRPLLFGGWEALVRSGCFSEFSLSWEKVAAFLSRAEKLYKTEDQTAYHNNIHAVDVAQTVHALSYDIGIDVFFDPMDSFVSVLSAIIHDLGHDGRNNAFHVNVQDELALTYNDRSVLENYHLSLAFKLFINDQDTNLLSGLAGSQLQVVRKEVIDMVLGTDMSQHFARVGEFSRLVTSLGDDAVAWQSEDAHMFVLRSMVLHSADISNPTKPFKMATQWSFRCLQEFFMQGDAEKIAGVPVSPLCDRITTDIPGSQIGFIQFIVTPAFEILSVIVPKVRETCLNRATGNMKAWEHRSKSRDFFEDTRELKQAINMSAVSGGSTHRSEVEPGAKKLQDADLQGVVAEDEVLADDMMRNAEVGFWSELFWGCRCR